MSAARHKNQVAIPVCWYLISESIEMTEEGGWCPLLGHVAEARGVGKGCARKGCSGKCVEYVVRRS